MFVFLLTQGKSPVRMILNLIICHNSSYNLGDMAQKFLPSYRKWLDYEVKNQWLVIYQSIAAGLSYMPLVSAR